MPEAGRSPNTALADWLHRAGWSQRETGRRIAAEARATGYAIRHPEGVSVRNWLAGRMPRDPVPMLLAAALSRHFGHPVTPEDLGFSTTLGTDPAVDIPWHPERTVERMANWTRADLMLTRRTMIGNTTGVAFGAALLNPLQTWLSTLPPALTSQRGERLVTDEDVDQIITATSVFRSWDNRFGGGLHRRAVVGQLAEVNDLVASGTYTASVGRRLRAAMADLAGVAAWMAYDTGEHQTAQRYWILGIHSAHDADDRALAAYLLSDMASQMLHLHRPQDALELLRMAWYGATYRGDGCRALRAQLASREAWAYAHLGRAYDVQAGLDRADQELHAPATVPTPDRLAYVNPAALQGGRGAVLSSLAVQQNGPTRQRTLATAIECSGLGVDHLDEAYARTRMRYVVDLVDAHMMTGDLDIATAAAERLAATAPNIASVRTLDEIRAVRARVPGRETDPKIRTLVKHLDVATAVHQV